MTPDITDAQRIHVRRAFPALASDTVFLENAGGSQLPLQVVDRMRDYMLRTYVQLGAGYELSRQATATVDRAHEWVSRLIRGQRGVVVLGSSTTSLLHVLAQSYAERWTAGDAIVLAETGHEANMGPWRRLEAQGIRIVRWPVDPDSFECSLEALDRVLEDRTRMVCFPHVSNLLGEIVDVQEITRRVHAAGARVVVDGVAYAPHRRIDVDAWDVDWYVYSTYKVYGPHMAALYGRADAIAELRGPNHFFIADDDLPYKFELGGPSHEGCAGILGLEGYLCHLLERPEHDRLDDRDLETAFELMARCELGPTAKLVEYLQSRPRVRIVGPNHAEPSRVGTVSFVHGQRSSREITEAVDRSGVAIRHGHMYAYDLCRALDLDPEDGVVRVSLVHYNTPQEIDRLIGVLEPLL